MAVVPLAGAAPEAAPPEEGAPEDPEDFELHAASAMSSTVALAITRVRVPTDFIKISFIRAHSIAVDVQSCTFAQARSRSRDAEILRNTPETRAKPRPPPAASQRRLRVTCTLCVNRIDSDSFLSV